MTLRRLILPTIVGLLMSLALVWVFREPTPPPVARRIIVTSYQYGYTPERIEVNRGDEITLQLKSKDVTHGFYLEGYDLEAKARPETPHFWARHPSQGDEFEAVEEITFRADRAGKFRYRCSITCGSLHPFMQGELIVRPNHPFRFALFAFPLVAVSLLIFASRNRGKSS